MGEVGRYATHEAYAAEYGVGGVEEYVTVDKGVEAVDENVDYLLVVGVLEGEACEVREVGVGAGLGVDV